MNEQNEKQPDAPRWDCLPHNPEGFFELEGEYDRKDLKRKYNRLLKQFKPEKHPAEFQRIRAAYEELDNRLRYGERHSRRITPDTTFDWTSLLGGMDIVRLPPQDPNQTDEYTREEISPGQDEQPTDPEQKPTPDQKPRPHRERGKPSIPEPVLPLFQRVQQEPLENIYEELRRKPEKTPQDYFALAFIGDALPENDRLLFLHWLLEGVKAWPGEPGLMNLLYDYFRLPIPANTIGKVLLATSKVIQEERFYYLTESLWERFVTEVPFPKFRRVLEKCELNLSCFESRSRLIFYLRLLKPAFWRADDNWLDEHLSELEELFDQLSTADDFDLEILMALREYREYRKAFQNGHPLRIMMDEIFRSYCEEKGFEVSQTFLKFQMQILSDSEDLLVAFPPGDDPAVTAALQAWYWIQEELAESIETQEPDDYHPRREESVRAFMRSLEAVTNRSTIGKTWDILGSAYMIFSMLIYLFIFVGVMMLASKMRAGGSGNQPLFTLLTVIGGVTVAWISGQALNQHFLSRWWDNRCLNFSTTCYHRIWRKEVLRYLRQSHFTLRGLQNWMDALREANTPCTDWVKVHSQNDAALEIFSSSLRFMA